MNDIVAGPGRMAAADNKVDAGDDAATPSSLESTPEPDAVPEISQEATAQPQKRKGGRKPVSATMDSRTLRAILTVGRYTRPLKKGSNETDKLKLPSERGGRSTSSSLRLRLNRMKIHSLLSSRVTGQPPTNV